jgi:hypothetical protein
MPAAQRPALPASGEKQLTKRNQISRLNQVQKAEPTTRPVHALLGVVLENDFILARLLNDFSCIWINLNIEK